MCIRDRDMVGKYGILMKKINGKYYGFDVSGHTVKGCLLYTSRCV